MLSLPEDQGQGSSTSGPLTAEVLHPICTLEASGSSNTVSIGLSVARTSCFQSCPGHSHERWDWECLFYGAQDKWPFSRGLPVPSPCRRHGWGGVGGWGEAAEALHHGFQHHQCGGGHKNPTVGKKKQVNVGCSDYPVPKPG